MLNESTLVDLTKEEEDPWQNILRKEFEELKDLSDYGNYQHLPNRKDRYSTVTANEATRVRLQMFDGTPGSDYINANYINGEVPGSYHYYIATQAPMSNTIHDFWRMVWEQCCPVIVMLTSLDEGNTSKADCYWPPEGKISIFGYIHVFHKKSFTIDDSIIVRSFLVKNTYESNIIREVIHLQYENWPDFGVPQSTKPLRDILLLMTKFKDRAIATYGLNGPIIIHCSAGLGRTGTLIASHITLERIARQQSPSIKQTVFELRKQRRGMVYNSEQYILIFEVVKDALKKKTCGLLSYLSTKSIF